MAIAGLSSEYSRGGELPITTSRLLAPLFSLGTLSAASGFGGINRPCPGSRTGRGSAPHARSSASRDRRHRRDESAPLGTGALSLEPPPPRPLCVCRALAL